MIRTYLTSASLFAMALLLVPGCGKKNEETQNPDGAGDGVVDGTTDGQGDTTAGTPDKARGSTATRGGGRPTAARAKTMKAEKPPRAPSKGTSVNGMAVEAWAIPEGATALPDFSTFAAAEQKTVVDMVNVGDRDAAEGFPGLKVTNNFATRLTGSINITTEAEYQLCLNSDDGSRLMLEGTLVVDNDGVKDGASETCAPVYLSAGEYMLEIHYFNADGARLALQFAWSQSDGEKALVPSEVQFKPTN
jgi:hypothetical protein